MSDDICCICLSGFKNKSVKELSCGHKIHFQCFMELVMRKNLFIECPLCRDINKNTELPHNDSKKNIIEIISKTKSGIQRCNCKTNDGKRCKNNSKPLNYGKCHIHNKSVLNEKYYPLMLEYMMLILHQRSGILTKIYLLDMGKKILMNYCDEKSTVGDIFSKYYEFYSIILGDGGTIVKDYKQFYEYYKLELPEKEWIDECKENYVIF